MDGRSGGPKSIYGLVDPRDGTVRYVGASQNPAKRFQHHLSTTMLESSSQMLEEYHAFRLWLGELADAGHKPDLRIFTDPVNNWREEERNFQKIHGATLLNPNDLSAYYNDEAKLSSDLAFNLSAARISAGLSGAQAAEALSTSPNTIYRWESGNRTPSIRQLFRIGAAYGVPTRSLIPEIDTPSQGAVMDSQRARGGTSATNQDTIEKARNQGGGS